MYSYDRTSAIDPSILGLTPSELAEATSEERAEWMVDALNRAQDLLVQIKEAFKPELSRPSQNSLSTAIREIREVTTKFR